MKARPLLFSAPMVRALLTGTKTQTRRAVKLNDAGRVKLPGSPMNWHLDDPDCLMACPYGVPGDLLIVREAWRAKASFDDLPPRDIPSGSPIDWLADPAGGPKNTGRYRHARFMPRWASRLTLRLTDVRVQRLTDIDGLDALAEGITRKQEAPWRTYLDLWNEIHGPGAWQKNPWVWALTFEVIRENVEAVLARKAAA